MSNPIDEFSNRIADSKTTPLSADGTATQRDRFELLSAYLDGEVTAAERRQIEAWLATDPKTQRLYARLLMLRQGLQTMPVAKSEELEQLVNQVTAKIERRPRRLLWGGVAIAAVFMGAVVGNLPRQSYAPSLADSLSPTEAIPTDGLMIAINHPPIEIPQSGLSSPMGVIQDLNPLHRSDSEIR
ncbi:MAG: zf-HC2 domain-containing protein [Elainella sp. Prado103]|jgi:anti-sigma factor RsiW|nr:zf-HC2 domain-containing protein [Elainella sp. Prado103]